MNNNSNKLITDSNAEKPHAKPLLTTNLGRLIDKTSYSILMLSAILIILISSYYFSSLATNGNGLTNSKNEIVVSFFDCMYFSIVTFTSLGYGDFLPNGYGKLVSCLVVFLGLIIIALLVGKVASERQYSMLLLMHTSDCQRRLKEFQNELKKSNVEITHYISKESLLDVSASINRLSKYLVFHANQSQSVQYGNHSALKGLYEEMTLTHKLCIDIFKSNPTDIYIANKCIYIVDKITSILRIQETISKTHATDAKRNFMNSICGFMSMRRTEKPEADTTFKQVSRTTEKFTQWYCTQPTNWMVSKVNNEKFNRYLATWPPHYHKRIANKLDISIRLVVKCINILKDRGEIES